MCLWFAYYNFCRVHQTLRVDTRDGSWLDESYLEIGRPAGIDTGRLPAVTMSGRLGKIQSAATVKMAGTISISVKRSPVCSVLLGRSIS